MNKKLIRILLILLLASLSVSACTGSSRFQTTSWPGVSLFEESLYVSFNQHVYQVDPGNGQELSRIPREADSKAVFFAAPIFTDQGDLIVGSYNNNLYNFNPDSGSTQWMYSNHNRFISSVLVNDDMIYAPNADHFLHAMDTQGNEVWSFETGGPLWSMPKLDNDTLFLASMDHFLYALDPANGEELWSVDLGGTTVGSPEIGEDGSLYIGTFESQVLAFDKHGALLWTFTTQDWVWGSLNLKDNVLYATDISGWLYAINATDGSLLWNFKGEGQSSAKPLVTETAVYFGTSAANFYSLDLEGNLNWSRTYVEESLLLGSPILSENRIIVPVTNAEAVLIAYDANGTIQWEFRPQK